ncbi:SGNH hydrolase-type esterase domain-containing protein [Thamnidium elegans]|nr:SGNH hydrolase-type esterase domain-containing protein [Thamnidium elegans]
MHHYPLQTVANFQVLQRDLATNTATVTAPDGTQVVLKTGGPFTIGEKRDIYVGDIWVMAGQSNMRGHGFLQDPFRTDVPDFPPVHLFDSTETWCQSSDPTHRIFLSERKVHHTLPDPTVRNPDICKYRGASLGPSFAAHYEPGVPVGLIASAHGGVSLNNWKRPVELTAETYDSTLYGAMISRIEKVGNNIAGVLWYQGESDTKNASDAETYGERFQLWVKELRLDIRANLPVLFVQLSTHQVTIPAMKQNWKTVQDQQRQLMSGTDFMVGVSSIDCGLDDRVHVSKDGLAVIGKRLARAAHLVLQGVPSVVVTPLPTFATFERIEYMTGVQINSIKLEFTLPPGFKFESNEMDLIGFELEGNKEAVLRARIEEDQRSIRLYLASSPIEGMTVQYGMNLQPTNLNAGSDCILPAFKGLVIDFI